MTSDECSETPTVAEQGPAADPHDDPAAEETQDGLESKVLLARARNKLLGWQEDPVTVGRYRVHERLGTGGMGVVYAAQDDELDRPVAIKILRTDLASGSAGRQRLLREAQAIAKLSHPNVVHVYEVGQEGGQVFMAMELVRGDTLRRWCQSTKRRPAEIVDVFLKVGEGLAAAHAHGIVHRDFKPDNVLVAHDGRPRVVDFGLARASGDANTTREQAVPMASASSSSSSALRDFDITRTGTVVGTPAYMAPEQLERAEPDARSDQFSFCASLFEALYGQRPFRGSTYTELTHSLSQSRPAMVDPAAFDVPRSLHVVVLRGLSRDPADRFATMPELLVALRTGLTPPPRRAWSYALAGSLGLAALGATAYAFGSDDPTPAPTQALEPVATDAWQQIVDATDLPPTIAAPLPGDPSRVTVHRLSNGLTIYVAHRPLEPFVTAALVVRANAKQEADGEDGLAQLAFDAMANGGEQLGAIDGAAEQPLLVLQHELLARLPTIRDPAGRDAILRAADAAQLATAGMIAPHELDRTARALGGREPIRLSDSGSMLAAEIPRHRLGAWVQLYAEALQHPNFRLMLESAQGRIETTKMMSEYRLLDMMSGRMLAQATGEVDDWERMVDTFERVPLADTQRFYATWFRPNNTALVLIGDITGDQAVPLVEQHFGAWAPATIPEVAEIDRPLAQARIQYEAEDAGPPMVRVSWPLPPAASPEHIAIAALEQSLGGPDGVLGVSLRDSTFSGGAWRGHHRDFNVEVATLEHQSLEDAEELVMGVMRSVAEDRVPETTWPRVLASAELARHRWARSSGALMQMVADSYLEHRPWAEVASTLSAPPPTREEVVAAARSLLQRGRVVAYKHTGKLWSVEAADLPVHRMPVSFGRQSPFVRSLVDAPSTPLEPRFLVAGSHYDASEHGAGRVITSKGDGPVFRMQWIYPVGVAEDPWICEAIHAWVHDVPIAGVDVDMYCTNEDTSFDVVGPASREAELMPALVDWLSRRDMPTAVVREYLSRELQWRTDAREDPTARALSVHMYALRGEHGLGAKLPDDAEMLRRGPTEMVRAWDEVHELDPDVLYVGPAPDRVRELLPTPTGRTRGELPTREFRELTGPTVLVLDDPEREQASVRVAIPWRAGTPREQLAAQLHAESAAEAERTGSGELHSEWPSYRVRWSPTAPVAIGIGYACDSTEVPLAIETAIAGVHRRLPEPEFDAARDRLEVAFRADRTPAPRVPELVRAWGRGADDPRVAQWLALPSLAYRDLQRYYDGIDGVQPIVSVVGDLSKIDMAALRSIGEIVQVELVDVIRDPALFEVGWDGPAMLEE